MILSGKTSLPQNDSSVSCLPEKHSTCRVPKTNSTELEAFLSTVEEEMFINTKRKYIKYNLINDEESSLTTWRRDILLNPDSDLLLRLQDKGNRFAVVDKQTGIVNANRQIEK